VGGLQLLITNEGRKIPLKAKEAASPEVGQKHKKKILSKPIDNL
jgi:hypothetical protein